MEKSSFFQKWYSESPKNCFHFTTFWSLIGTVFDSKNILWHPMPSVLLSKLVNRVIDLQQSNSECLKWHQSHYRSVWKWKLDFKPLRILLVFGSSKSLQKKLFLKCQQATSNPNVGWSMLPMTTLCICFSCIWSEILIDSN